MFSDETDDTKPSALKIIDKKDLYIFSIYIWYFLILSLFLASYLYDFESILFTFQREAFIIIILFTFLFINLFKYQNMLNKTYFLVNMIYFPISFITIPIYGIVISLRKLFKVKRVKVVDTEELIDLVSEAAESGEIDGSESELIKNMIEFDDCQVKEIYTPRTSIVCLDINTPIDIILNTFIDSGYSRIPLYKEHIDQIIGTVNFKDFIKEVHLNKQPLLSILDKPIFITEHDFISEVLKQLRSAKLHLAIVNDEFGGTLGILTLEDIIEEIVGEIYDEHDEDTTNLSIEGNTLICDGTTPYDEIFEHFNITLDSSFDEKDYNSIGGLIIDLYQDFVPLFCVVKYKGLQFTVLELDKLKIKKVKIEKINDDK
jgi:CBS domain containing-hemolysin-like protein